MSEVRNPFAIRVRNGKMIMIKDLSEGERGKKCRCKCPACGGDFVARMGKKKIHHFAHDKGACDEIIAYIAGLYRVIMQILSAGVSFPIPALAISHSMPNDRLLNESELEPFVRVVGKYKERENTIKIRDGASVVFEHIEFSYDSKKNIQAMELSYKSSKMAIKVKPPDTICKSGTVSPHNKMATLVVDFTVDADVIQNSNSVEFTEYLLSGDLVKYWISNPLIKKAYPQLLEINKNDYSEHLKREERLEEERKSALERHRQLEEELRLDYIMRQKRLEEEVFESVKEKFGQHSYAITDSQGYRWLECGVCGKRARATGFWDKGMGRFPSINIGVCATCRMNRHKTQK